MIVHSCCRNSWHCSDIDLSPSSSSMPIQRVTGTHLDIEAVFEPPMGPEPSGRVGFILKSWRSGGKGAALVTFDWSTLELTVDFDEAFPHAYDPYPDESLPGAKRVGGKLMNMKHGK